MRLAEVILKIRLLVGKRTTERLDAAIDGPIELDEEHGIIRCAGEGLPIESAWKWKELAPAAGVVGELHRCPEPGCLSDGFETTQALASHRAQKHGYQGRRKAAGQ